MATPQTAVIPVEFRLPALPVVDAPSEVPEVRVVRVQPGDVLAVRFRGQVTDDVADLVGQMMKKIFPSNESVLLDDGAEIEVLRKDGA